MGDCTGRMYNEKKLPGQQFYAGTMLGKWTSLSNENVHALRQFIRGFGIPERLMNNEEAKQVKGNSKLVNIIQENNIAHHIAEPHCSQKQLPTEKSENNEPSVNRFYVSTVRSCHAPPCPMERDLHCPLAAIPMALTSPTPSMRLTQRTGSKPRGNSITHSQANHR